MRQAIVLAAAFVVALLAASPAMAGTASVEGTTLRFDAPAIGEVNNLTVTQSGDSYAISDTAPEPMGIGNGCSADGTGAICSAVDAPIDQIVVDVGDGDDTVVVTASTPAQVLGGAGNDSINVQNGVPDSVQCGEGSDTVTSDRADIVPRPECEVNDDGVFPITTILAGPLGPPGNTAPRFNFVADEEPVQFQCAIAPFDTPEDQFVWSSCSPNQTLAAPAEGKWTFKVYALDDIGAGGVSELTFVVDTTPPTLTISGPASPIATSTPTFEIKASEPSVRFECSIDGGASTVCDSPYTALPLPDGDHVLEVRGTDLGRNEMVATFPFRVSVPGGNGVAPGAPGTPAAPRRIIIDSLVLISGSGVKMSRRGVVGIRLTCAGTRTCKGRMRITTAEPVSRKSRKLVTLGAKRFTIAANKKRKVNVRFSKSKRRLAKRLKRFKAKVVISEVDQRGNPRISSRVFILRAR